MLLEGLIAGQGPHYIVAMFDGYGAISSTKDDRLRKLVEGRVHGFEGGVYSGYGPTNAPPGTWVSDAPVQVAADQYKTQLTVKLQSFQTPSSQMPPIDSCP